MGVTFSQGRSCSPDNSVSEIMKLTAKLVDTSCRGAGAAYRTTKPM